MIVDTTKIENVEIEGVDTKDYPNFCNAFVASATYEGREMTDEELESLNDDPLYSVFIYDTVIKSIF